MYTSKIVGHSSYLPENILTNDDFSKFLDTSDEWIYSRTGIKQRHVSKVNTSVLCTNAANILLEKFNIDPLTLDAIIVATSTPDYTIPSVSALVQGNIKASNAMAIDINSACSGFVFALSTADKYIKCGNYKNILVIGGEVTSKQLDYTDRTTSVLFGDGAGAILLQRTDDNTGIISEKLETHGDKHDFIVSGFTGVNNTLNKEDGYPYLSMKGRDVFNFVTRVVMKNIISTLENVNLTIDDIDFVVPHQANIRIIEVLARKLKCDPSKVFTNIDKVANTSAGSLPIILDEMFNNGSLTLGSKQNILLTAFGGGMSCGSLVITL